MKNNFGYIALITTSLLAITCLLIKIEYGLIAAISLLPIVIIYRDGRIRYSTILILLMVVLLSRLLYSSDGKLTSTESLLNTLSVSGIVISEPNKGDKSLQIILNELKIGTSKEILPGKVIAYLPLYSRIKYGDKILLKGRVESLESIEDSGYQAYLSNQGINALMMWPKMQIISENHGNVLVRYGIELRQYIDMQINSLMPQDEAAFLTGVVLGSKQKVTGDFSESLKITGTTHLIVASGYNISILISIVMVFTKKLRRISKYILLAIMIACYMLIAGLEVSIIRAALMATLALIATGLGRQRHALLLLLVAAWAMLIINPKWISDIGFQLSFMATLGIILLQKTIKQRLTFFPEWLGEALSTSLAAQLLVFPIILVAFGTISFVSIFTNLLVVWVIPFIMIAGIVLIGASLLIPFIASWIAIVAYFPLWYVKHVIILTSKIPWASISLSISWLYAVMYYALLSVFALQIAHRDKKDKYVVANS